MNHVKEELYRRRLQEAQDELAHTAMRHPKSVDPVLQAGIYQGLEQAQNIFNDLVKTEEEEESGR